MRILKTIGARRARGKSMVKVSLVIFGLVFLTPLLISQQGSPDLILLNGKIFTSDDARPYVQALAVRGEHIVATGDSEKIKALAGPRTRLIDLGGRTVIPGINDAHNHIGLDPPGVVH